jgi:protein-arginine kinase activator protein McsA
MAEKRNMNGKKPIAIGIDTGCRNTANLPRPGGFRVEYKCSKCGEVLCGQLGSKERHCHHCGQKIDWRVITYLNSIQSDKIDYAGDYVRDDIIDSYIKMINKLNEEKGFDSEVYISEVETAATA